jgi:excisionase family DNA binding protein
VILTIFVPYSVVESVTTYILQEEAVMVDQEELLTLTEFRTPLKITMSCTRRWVLEHRIAVVKVGRLVRVPRSELERIVQEGLRPAQAKEPSGKPAAQSLGAGQRGNR